MKKLLTLIALTVFTLNPIIGQTKKELKAEKKQKEYLSTKELIDSKQYEFTGEWATSNTGRQINLISNPTFMKIDNTKGDAFFPFFGTAHSGAGYSTGNGGIEFKNELEDYTVTYNDKKQKIVIKFNVKSENDNYKVTINAFAGGNTSITIDSNNRSVMNYSGDIKALEKKEAK